MTEPADPPQPSPPAGAPSAGEEDRSSADAPSPMASDAALGERRRRWHAERARKERAVALGIAEAPPPSPR